MSLVSLKQLPKNWVSLESGVIWFYQVSTRETTTGVVGFTKTVAKELGQFGIRCNVVLPGEYNRNYNTHFIKNYTHLVSTGEVKYRVNYMTTLNR